ncbi:sucrose transport protein SUC3-like [Cucurbita pepo subsp. pepo]|uniref:sucrose transport protein SUC3-like n=1 Tax=Cucurbita pepo subsp. pepo TaxID=3664 RepID=UPI000C9D5D34|nr:sucrose transport protein SUC3-like [Cucurbita pepo subsp. pepo]
MAAKPNSVSFRVPYRNIHDAEVEMVAVDEQQLQGIDLNSPPSDGFPNGSPDSSSSAPHVRSTPNSLIILILSCTIAAGVQFGWALQLSLLTPYIQTLGIEHAFSSFIWLCGPITGLVVQPCVGIWSDKCSSKYGRRRPFILAGSLMIAVAVVLIGFSADVGYILGDTNEHCSVYKGTRVRAAIIFVIGFWMLDLANNTVQGPARALLADLSGPDQHNIANAVFCSWMAVGNILGFSAGANGNWHKWFPFLLSNACCEACANLKAAFLVAVLFLTICTLVTIYFADEVPLTAVDQPPRLSDSAPLLNGNEQNCPDILKPELNSLNGSNVEYGYQENMNLKDSKSKIKENHSEGYYDGPATVVVKLLTSLRHLPPAMHSVLLVMALSWLSWFPFFLFDTDWMGREVNHGDPKGSLTDKQVYDQGVREGAFGLLLNSVVLGISSFFIEPMCQRMGARLVWAMSNFMLFACMTATTIISLISVSQYSEGVEHVIGGNSSIKNAALAVFTLLGFPLAITYSVPFSLTAELTADSGGGQGLAIGVLNLAVVIPQMIVSLGAGPWDALFNGGNIPAFALASICALAAGIVAVLRLPNQTNSSFKSTGFHFG